MTFITNDLSKDFELNLAKGIVPGHKLINRFGNNPDIDTSTIPEDIWASGGLYTGFPTGVAQYLNLYSTNSSDSSNGIGARTVYIEGLNNDYVEQSEIVSLSGSLPVSTTKTYRRCNFAYVTSAGSNNSAIGAIGIFNQSGIGFCRIDVGENQTHLAAYTIPSGTTGYLVKLYGYIRRTSGSAAFDRDANVDFLIRPTGGVFRATRSFGITTGGVLETHIYGGLRLEQMTDIIPRVTAVSENNTDVAIGYDVILVNN